MTTGSTPRVPVQLSRQCLVASIQVDLTEDVLRQFRRDLLDRLQASGAAGVILDVSGLDVMDYEDFEALRRTMSMAEVMGARTLVCGLSAGVVSSLVELGVHTEDVEAALSLDEAFRLMDERRPGCDEDPADAEPIEELGAEPPDQAQSEDQAEGEDLDGAPAPPPNRL